MKLRVTLACGLLAVLAGCTDTTAGPPPPQPDLTMSPVPQIADPTPPASSACPATVDLPTRNNDLPEMQGVGQGATLFGLFFSGKATAGRQIEVVWRMTGEGPLKMVATGPGGTKLRPQWGPETREGSNYHRPGDEWNTGWTFPESGCWLIEATRQHGSARISIRVG